MIRDLTSASSTQTQLDADVLVVGGGIAGLILATRLANYGKRVVVLESGGETQETETHALNEVEHLRSVYSGAESGRFRCLGGTSTRWGGAMIPFVSTDMEDGDWPITHDDLLAYLPAAERLFELPISTYSIADVTTRHDGKPPSHVARLASWPAFRRRNVAILLASRIRSDIGPEVWLHANANIFNFSPAGRLESIAAEAPNGRRMVVRAPHTVIAAGAIESTRLLLLADLQNDNRIFAPDNVLGRYFHDHLSAKVGDIAPIDRQGLNRIAGFQFTQKSMRNIRFETSESREIREQIPPGFAHIHFNAREGSGFDALRRFYQHLQQGRLPNADTVAQLARATPWLSRAVWWRFVEHRLLYPSDAIIELHMVIQQRPVPENRILLSTNKLDAFGQPLAAIDWGISPEDVAALNRSTHEFHGTWTASKLARLGEIKRRSRTEIESELAIGGGIYHPAGSTRMGRSKTRGVLDSEFRTFRVPNIRLVTTAAFPACGGGNPTMMLIMAALRTADRMAKSSI